MTEANRIKYLRIALLLVGLTFTLGVFRMIASRDPMAHRSLIWFTVWSSIVHGGIMGIQSVVNPMHMRHLIGDVAALIAVAGVLAILTPRKISATILRSAA